MLVKKLKIKENEEIIALHAPVSYEITLGKLPKGAKIKTRLNKNHNFVHLFVRNKAELQKTITTTAKAINPGGLLWISYPKISSGMQSDLSRDKGWECLEKINMRWISLISFDNNWSAFLLRNEAPIESRKASKDYQDTAALFIDTANKQIRLPEDLKSEFSKNKKALSFFESLSFTGKKEYVLWIVSAKREITRVERVKKTIEKLLASKKNPSEK